MDVVWDEDNAFFLSSTQDPPPASDPSSRSELSAHRSSSNGAEGYTKLLRAALLDQGVEEVGSG